MKKSIVLHSIANEQLEIVIKIIPEPPKYETRIETNKNMQDLYIESCKALLRKFFFQLY